MMTTLAQPILLKTPDRREFDDLSAIRAIVASSQEQIRQLVAAAEKDGVWISEDSKLTLELLKTVSWPVKRLGRILLLFEPNPETLPALGKCFDRIAFGPARQFLCFAELADALAVPNREDLFIGCSVNHESQLITLWRGNFDTLVVPFSAFEISGDGIAPNFQEVQVADYGQTVRLGDYEAATDALLYEFDDKYRRRKKKELHKSEQGLGASIRRLRKQRGLRREDFAPLDPKTIARIEQGKVAAIHGKTMQTIAAKLQVSTAELATF